MGRYLGTYLGSTCGTCWPCLTVSSPLSSSCSSSFFFLPQRAHQILPCRPGWTTISSDYQMSALAWRPPSDPSTLDLAASASCSTPASSLCRQRLETSAFITLQWARHLGLRRTIILPIHHHCHHVAHSMYVPERALCLSWRPWSIAALPALRFLFAILSPSGAALLLCMYTH